MELKPFCLTPNSVFDDRNKSYGAYTLRQTYDERVTWALLTVIISSALLFGFPHIKNWINSLLGVPEETVTPTIYTTPPFDPKVEVKEVQEQGPLVEIDVPPPPKIDQKEFVPVLIVDEPIQEQELNTIKDLKNAIIGSENIVGDPSVEGEFRFLEKNPGGTLGDGTGLDNNIPKNDFVEVAQIEAQYPGGIQEFYKAVKKELRYPQQAEREEIGGKVYIRFIIEKDGSMSNLEIVKGIGHGLDEEALRVLTKIAIKNTWIPAQQNGVTVRQRKTLPIEFKISK